MAESEDNKTKSGSEPSAKPGATSSLSEPREETRKKPDEDPVGKVYDAHLMRRLGHYVRPYWLQAGIAALAVTLKSLCDVAGPILVMVAVDRYLAPDLIATDPSNAVARRDIFRHMQRMHVGFFDMNPVGRLVTRITSDVDAVNDMFTDGVLAIVNDFFMLAIMAAVMLAISWWLALLALGLLVALLPPLPFAVYEL